MNNQKVGSKGTIMFEYQWPIPGNIHNYTTDGF